MTESSTPVVPPTERLYYDDSLRLVFDARVLAHAEWSGTPSVVLDRSAFYPESGGQMSDRGTLAGVAVRDVQVDDAGVVHHVLDGPMPAVGAEVQSEIDRARRRVHMALHTGQHMLSRALLDVARGETVSSRLGETSCTIDIRLPELDEREAQRAEDLVNSVIDDDVVVRSWFPDAAELATLALRRAPKVTDHVRVVDVAGFDVSPCGGTHCTRTAQVGFVRIVGIERYKGMIRVSFHAGRRAREELGADSTVLRAIARDQSCGPRDVPAAMERVRADWLAAREALGRARLRLASVVADEWLAAARAAGSDVVKGVLDEGDAEYVRAVGTRIVASGPVVACVAARGAEGLHVFIARGAGSSVDCGALLKRVAAEAGGRGGGRAERAEGRLPHDADWVTLVSRG